MSPRLYISWMHLSGFIPVSYGRYHSRRGYRRTPLWVDRIGAFFSLGFIFILFVVTFAVVVIVAFFALFLFIFVAFFLFILVAFFLFLFFLSMSSVSHLGSFLVSLADHTYITYWWSFLAHDRVSIPGGTKWVYSWRSSVQRLCRSTSHIA